MRRALAILVSCCLLLVPHTRRTVAQTPGNAPAEIRIPVPPTPATLDGRTVLAYELHITNFLPRDLTLNRVEVFGQSANSPALAVYEGERLDTAFTLFGGPPANSAKGIVGSYRRAVVYMWLTVDKPDDVPTSLHHRFSFSFGGTDGRTEERVIDAARVEVLRAAPVVVPPPFKGGTWIAANGPSDRSIHRRALLLAGGQLGISQRFAIDWLKLSEDGKVWHGDPKINANWYSYGIEVLSVADATVSAVKDGIPENVPLSSERAVPMTQETSGGNHVILALGNGQHAFYAHLQPGSLRVKVGDRLRRGQVLGLIGNSGNSDAPHLHFHLADKNSPFVSEGLPYVFQSFDVLGTVDLNELLAKGDSPLRMLKPDKRIREIPAENAVVRFD